MHVSNTWNAVPETVVLRGTCRFFNPDNPGYPVTINTEAESKIAAEVAAEIVGSENVNLNPISSMGAEDFAFMLQEKPGCYIWIGNGPSAGSCLLHNPHFTGRSDLLG